MVDELVLNPSATPAANNGAQADSASATAASLDGLPVVFDDTATSRLVGQAYRRPLRDGGEGPEMVVIPGGSFLMGSPESEDGHQSDEGPQRTVTIRSFAMGTTEVTFADYDRCTAAGVCEKADDQGWGRGTRPVINVNWDDATQYAKWLSEQTGKRYRLPTEAEWEYAARGGTTSAYWWGSEIGRNRANCGGCGSEWDAKQTAPVRSFAKNSFGLYEVSGNAWEWV